jgi:hypothetical protein
MSAILLAAGVGGAQTGNASLRGQVVDPSGAAIPATTVQLTGPHSTTYQAQTDEQGRYAFKSLPSGTYTLTIHIAGFDDFVKSGIQVARNKPQTVNAQLVVASSRQQVTVTEESNTVSLAPSENASAVLVKGKDLDALSDDPDDLQSELQALAGPSAGPMAGQIFVDGFNEGEIPPKSSIREIRVNQNPFSAQYDSLGYGRIEILTKPGTTKLHGSASITGNDSAFNTRNPFAGEVPGYHSETFGGSLGGPINSKTSFFVGAYHRDIQNDAIVDALILDPALNPTSLVEPVAAPQTRTSLSPRIDTQIGTNDTLTFSYHLWQNDQKNSNVGQFVLPEAAYGDFERWQSFMASDSHVINEKAITEIRFRYGRDDEQNTPASSLPGITVAGAFTGGGSILGATKSTANYYEFQNYTSLSYSRHFVKFGVRVRDHTLASTSNADFNGSYTFPSLAAYQITEQGLQGGLTPAEIRTAGGGASQFTLTTGNPLASLDLYDIEPYVEDDWKIRPNLTLSGGLRFETQNHIQDHADFAPRLGFAWGLNKSTVIRGGYGIFYDRFTDDYVLNAIRYNGLNQQQYFIANPDYFPAVPPASSLTATPTLYVIDPRLRAPYASQAGIGLERQIKKNAMISVTYLNTHGVHQLLTRNINAPDAANADDARPNPSGGDLYQYETDGLYNQNQLITNFNVRKSRVTLFGFYTLGFADSNTTAVAAFPMNSYDLAEDYGRATYDVRHRLLVGGSWNLPKGFQLFPFIVANSAPPFNIAVGDDLNGDSIFNDRPAFASSLSNPANVVVTRWGNFDTVPVAGEKIIPMNYGTGFIQFAANLRVSKTFAFGKSAQGASGGASGGGPNGGGGGLGRAGLSSMGTGGNPMNASVTTNRRYNLTFSASIRNIFNNVNDGLPVGTLGSPIFGKPNALIGGFFSRGAANRRIDLQVRFNF